VARIEVPPEDHQRIIDEKVCRAIVAGLRSAGFRFVCVDLAGFRSGGLNEVLREE
jgi:uncharacterized protein